MESANLRKTYQRKWYNPYEFPVRMKNDLGEDQILVPFDRGKSKDGEYSQSALVLQPYDPDDSMETVKGFGEIELEGLLKEDLVKLAWAVCLNTDFNGKTKKQIAAVIMKKAGSYVKWDGGPSTEKNPAPKTGEAEIQKWLQERWVE